MKQYNIPPLIPLVGSTFYNYLRIIAGGSIDSRYYIRTILTGLVILIARPFHVLDRMRYNKKIKKYRFKKDPLFIIGHWRSGTTLMHNCLCQDKNSAYLTTYQALFPNNLASTVLFKTFTRIGMPEKRPSDNMELNTNYPQEDEFSLGNLHSNFYYKFFYFPAKYKEYYDQAVRMRVNLVQKNKWKRAYSNLLKKAAINTGGDRLVVKNPANTARIGTLLEMFPNAKFLYLYRNPFTVFLSTQRFFNQLLPTIWLQEVDENFVNQMIMDIYARMTEDYQDQKHLIPPGNLLEIKYEEFEQEPMETLNAIYTDLLGEDFNRVQKIFNQYLVSLKNHKKNNYSMNRDTADMVLRNCEKYMNIWNYGIPEDIAVS